jgi:hypothetical protein
MPLWTCPVCSAQATDNLATCPRCGAARSVTAPPPIACPHCGGVTAPGYVVDSGNGRVAQFHGTEKDFVGTSQRRTGLQARICTACGIVTLLGANPEQFFAEVEDAGGREVSPAPPPAGRGDEPSPTE